MGTCQRVFHSQQNSYNSQKQFVVNSNLTGGAEECGVASPTQWQIFTHLIQKYSLERDYFILNMP